MSIFHWLKSAPKETKNAAINALILLVFSLIYHLFSHGVLSTSMMLAFTIPLIHEGLRRMLSITAPLHLQLLEMSNHTWSIALLLYGVFEIYGSIQPLVYGLYGLAALILLLVILLSLFTNKAIKQ